MIIVVGIITAEIVVIVVVIVGIVVVIIIVIIVVIVVVVVIIVVVVTDVMICMRISDSDSVIVASYTVIEFVVVGNIARGERGRRGGSGSRCRCWDIIKLRYWTRYGSGCGSGTRSRSGIEGKR